MGRIRGFLLEHRPTTLLRRSKFKPFHQLIGWAHNFRTQVGPGQPVPKGYMGVYVGEEDGDFRRILVPVVYFNHPLFGELLRECENEFGFDQPGGLTIPCGVSDFERVRTRIKTTRKLLGCI